jgi:hypothetical protein
MFFKKLEDSSQDDEETLYQNDLFYEVQNCYHIISKKCPNLPTVKFLDTYFIH